MRLSLLVLTLTALLLSLVAASPSPADSTNKREKVALAFGKQETLQNRLKDTKADAATYLITLERTITNSAKDNILDVLLKAGAIVKQEYDYKVFKGILFSVPSADRGLTSWQAALTRQDGVKYVELDQVVKVQ